MVMPAPAGIGPGTLGVHRMTKVAPPAMGTEVGGGPTMVNSLDVKLICVMFSTPAPVLLIVNTRVVVVSQSSVPKPSVSGVVEMSGTGGVW